MLENLIKDSQVLEKAMHGDELSFKDGVELLHNDDIHLVGATADRVRKHLVGDKISFVSSYYLNYTNVCAASCQMCAFYRKKDQDGAYTLTINQIRERVTLAKNMGATELHIVGGFHPDLGLDYYEDMMCFIKKDNSDLSIKAFTAAEIFYISKHTKNSVREVLTRLKKAGLDSLPGGGAELFHPDIRDKITLGKCSGQQWLDTIYEAHTLGIKSNATMLYGHIEKPEHIVDHLVKLRDLQKKTGGFITFIPLKFSLDNTKLEQDGLVSHECSSIYDLKIIALSRMMLANSINNISVYWIALGKRLAQIALTHGGSDLVGTAFSEEIYKATGKNTTSSLNDLAHMSHEINRIPVQRDTFYNEIKTF